jgi:hypothetical protein
MEPRNKFRLKTFLYYILLEPWTEKLTLPNFRTLNTVLLCISLLYKWRVGILISIGLLVVLQLIDEWKKGDYIYWYRNRKGYGNYKEIIKKVKEEKKQNEI